MSSNTIELKKRRRWPYAIGTIVVIVAIVAAVIGFTGGGDDKKAFGSDLTVVVYFPDGSEQRVIEYVNQEIAPDYDLSLKVRAISDVSALWEGIQDGDVAAGLFTTQAYYDDAISANGYRVKLATGVHNWQVGSFSTKYASWAEVPDGATVALRADPAGTNLGLRELARAGLIEVADKNGGQVQVEDVTSNPHDFEFTLLDNPPVAAQDVDVLVSLTSDALQSGKVTISDVLDGKIDATDPVNNGYLAIGSDYADDPNIEKLVKAFADPRLQEWLGSTDDVKIKDRFAPFVK